MRATPNKAELDEEFRKLKEAPVEMQETPNVGPGLPIHYDLPEAPDTLPESPFEELNPGQLCVRCDGFHYAGRVVIPQSAKRSSTAGRVVATGPNSKYKRNDRILFTQFAGSRFICEGIQSLRVMTEQEVIGKLKEKITVLEEE